MLSLALEKMTDEREGVLRPERMAALLRMSMSDLASLTGLHRNTLTMRPQAPAVQGKIGMIARILASAAELSGSEGKAIVWFRHQPLAGFDGRTAAELVAAGQSNAVLAHLEMLRDGVYA